MAVAEEDFHLLFEAVPTGIMVVDDTGLIAFANRRAEAMFGYGPDELQGLSVGRLIPERFRAAHPLLRSVYQRRPIPQPMGAGRDLSGLRQDNTEFPLEIWLNPLVVNKRRLVVACVSDISERKRQSDHVQTIMHELAHRSKNLLAVIQSIAHQTLARSGSLAEFKANFDNRLRAVAQTQNLLLEANWVGVTMIRIVDEHLRPFVESGARIEAKGPILVLKPDLAQRLGLALHELATNATKYGALSSPAGRVQIEWALDQADKGERFRLSWRESGGPPPPISVRRGFGHRLLAGLKEEGLCDHLDMDFAPEGFCWSIECTGEVLVQG